MDLDTWPKEKKVWQEVEEQAEKGRKQIRDASQNGDNARAFELANHALDSHYERLLAVDKVLSKHNGHPTPGVDGLTYDSDEEKMQLVYRLRDERQAEPDPLLSAVERRDDGSEREVFPPTLFDRSRQTHLASIIKSLNTHRLSPGTFGTGKSRDVPAAYKKILTYLRDERMLTLKTDIRRCFDDFPREYLLEAFIGPDKLKREVATLLDAEVGAQGSGRYPGQGAPQGMPLSPLLVTIALDYLEAYVFTWLTKKPKRRPLFIRYLDDILILHPDREVLDDCYRLLNEALDELSLMLNPNKTLLSQTNIAEGDFEEAFYPEGFTFLGWKLEQYPAPPLSDFSKDPEGKPETYLTLVPKKGKYGPWVRGAVGNMVKAVKGRALVIDGYFYSGWDTRGLAPAYQSYEEEPDEERVEDDLDDGLEA